MSTATAAGHASVVAGNATAVGALLLLLQCLRLGVFGPDRRGSHRQRRPVVPSFRVPRVKRAQRAEVALGAVLGVMLVGLSVLISRFHLQPVEGVTVLPQLADASLGCPRTPHVFALKADRQVHRHGVLALAAVSAALLVFSGGDQHPAAARRGLHRCPPCPPRRIPRRRGPRGDRLLPRPRGVPLVRLASVHRTLGRPIAAYVRVVAAADPTARVTVLIPEAEPARLWQRLLQNQRGAIVAHAVRRETDAVVCMLRFRLG